MKPLLRTAAWTVGTLVALYAVLSVVGYQFMRSHHNDLAQTIFDDHLDLIVSIYARIGIGYVVAGVVAALLLHPFVRGWKLVPATLVLVLFGLLYTLTSETQLLYGPTHTLFSTIHDAIPSWIRALYAPFEVLLLLGAFALWSLHRWTHGRGIVIGASAALILLGLGALARLPARQSGKRAGPPNLVLIATDSLRADHLGCNGYSRATSPHIDALASRGINFSNCLVPTASTHESWISIFSSTHPRTNGLRHMFPSRQKVERIEREQTFFPRLLRDDGYATAVIGGWCGTTFGIFDVGFEKVDVSNTQNHRALVAEAAFTNHLLAAAFLDNPVGRLFLPELDRVSFTRGASAITRRANRFLDGAAGTERPFLLTVVYHVTHLPYSASYPYYTLFTDPEYRGRNRYRIDFLIDDMIQRGFDHDLAEEETRHIIDLYDGCVREFDDQVGAIVEHLERLGLLENTIIGVMADHGDDLYEHGTTLGHGVTLFGGDHANHIPAVFAGPGIEPRRVEKLVRSYDLTPTWMRWLGKTPPKKWEGEDLSGEVPNLWALLETSYLLYRQPVPDLRPGEQVAPFPKLDQATFFDPDFDHNLVLKDHLEPQVFATKCFAVRSGRWKLIRVPGSSGPIFRLFDLEADPECRTDLAAAGHPELARLKALMPPQPGGESDRE